MKRALAILGAVAVVTLGLTACSGGGGGGQQVKTTSPAERQQKATEMSKKITDLQGSVDTMKTAADKLGAEAKDKVTKAIAEIQPQLDDAKKRLLGLAQAGDEMQYQEFKASMDAMLKSLEDQINKMKADLGLGGMPAMPAAPAAPAMPAAPKAS